MRRVKLTPEPKILEPLRIKVISFFYLARAFPGGSARLCQWAESVSKSGSMVPSRVRVICWVSRQKML